MSATKWHRAVIIKDFNLALSNLILTEFYSKIWAVSFLFCVIVLCFDVYDIIAEKGYCKIKLTNNRLRIKTTK